MKILFLTKYPIEGPSSRYRVYQYTPYLEKRGFQCVVCPSLSSKMYHQIYLSNAPAAARRYYQLQNSLQTIFRRIDPARYDLIYIQKEVNPAVITPSLLRRFSGKIIFDLDDAIFTGKYSRYLADRLLQKCRLVVAGNDFLSSYALKHNHNVKILPTPVDLNQYGRARDDYTARGETVIGWVGSAGNLKYLEIVEDVLAETAAKHDIRLKIISNSPWQINGVKTEYKPWSLAEEIADLQGIDIGIMPLADTEWTRGKCAFKALQYMSLGIPTISSRVGFNQEVITDGINGFLASTEEEWLEKLEQLIKDEDLRAGLGKEGRRTVEEQYSVETNIDKLVDILNSVVD